MTVIAWDGKTLAADRRACLGNLYRTIHKLHRLSDCLCASAGGSDAAQELIAWFEAGRDPAAFPPSQRDKDSWAGLLVVWPDGSLWRYERTPYPVKFPPQQFAIGSGRDFALAAMWLGKTAAEAVDVACRFDSSCGNGVDTLTFEEAR